MPYTSLNLYLWPHGCSLWSVHCGRKNLSQTYIYLYIGTHLKVLQPCLEMTLKDISESKTSQWAALQALHLDFHFAVRDNKMCRYMLIHLYLQTNWINRDLEETGLLSRHYGIWKTEGWRSQRGHGLWTFLCPKGYTTEEAVNNKIDEIICSEDIIQPLFLVT